MKDEIIIDGHVYVRRQDNQDDVMNDIKKIISNSDYSFKNFIYPQFEGKYITMKLPVANKEWTFAVWDIVQKVCDKYQAIYVEHYPHFDSKKVYINVSDML